MEVGIKDVGNTNNHLQVGFPYPNPSNGKFSIDIDLDKKVAVQIALYDVFGKQISYTVKDDFTLGKNTLKLKYEDLSKGVYFLVVRNGKEKVSRKLVVE